MKKLNLKKVTLAEMPADAMMTVNGGAFDQEARISSDPVIASVLLSIYLTSIIMSGVHCASADCQSRDCNATSKASYCLC